MGLKLEEALSSLCVCVCVWVGGCMLARSVMSDSLQTPGPQPARLLCPWDFPGKNTGVGLVQGKMAASRWRS